MPYNSIVFSVVVWIFMSRIHHFSGNPCDGEFYVSACRFHNGFKLVMHICHVEKDWKWSLGKLCFMNCYTINTIVNGHQWSHLCVEMYVNVMWGVLTAIFFGCCSLYVVRPVLWKSICPQIFGILMYFWYTSMLHNSSWITKKWKNAPNFCPYFRTTLLQYKPDHKLNNLGPCILALWISQGYNNY